VTPCALRQAAPSNASTLPAAGAVADTGWPWSWVALPELGLEIVKNGMG
jgi:hypothetical protein